MFLPETILAFVFLLIVNLKDCFFSCVNYLNLSFDSQIPLTWDFTVLNNMLPYKDIYFPYGLLFYFKNTSLYISLIYFFLPILLFFSVYIVFKTIFKSRIITFIAFVSFCLFIYKYTGIENFTRYGIILSFTLLISHFFYKLRIISFKSAFLFGILVGGIFSLVNDQGIYSLLLLIFLLITVPVLRGLKKMHYVKYLLSRLIACGLGLVLGLLPLFVFLNVNNMTNEFYLFIKHLSDFPLYAKTPFIPFSTTIDNLFAFASLFIAIVVLSYKIFFSRTKLSFISILEISLIFILVMLEQKSVIRSIDKQITFIAFILYVIMFSELIKNKVSNLIIYSYFAIIYVFILLGIGLHPFINYKLSFDGNLVRSFFSTNMENFLVKKSKLCLSNNLNRLTEEKNTKLEKVKNIIEEDSKKPTKIFDYLSDPAFYILFNQKPPYYFTIFEATPLYAQKSNVKYIEENKVKYVIYNEDIVRLQDGVPTQIRNKFLFSYVLKNFEILSKVDNFIIYKKI